MGGVILPIVVPHWEPSVLKWLNPSHYGGRHYLYYCKTGLGKHPYLAQELTNLRTVLLFKTSGTPVVTFLQRNACKFRETLANWVGKSDVFYIEPFGRPFFRRLPWCTGQVSGIGDVPYFGSAHFKY